jgi:hypothetical protein
MGTAPLYDESRAPGVPLALRETARVRETAMAAATYIVRGGADAAAVSCLPRPVEPPTSMIDLL